MLREAKQPVPSELLAFGTTVKKKESKVCAWPAARTQQHLHCGHSPPTFLLKWMGLQQSNGQRRGLVQLF